MISLFFFQKKNTLLFSFLPKLIFTFFLLINNSIYCQTGIPVSSMTTCDQNVTNFMNEYAIPGLTFALSKNGKLVYMRAFGNARTNNTESTQPYHLFRIASLSKPITSIAIMHLLQNGKLGMNDLVFGPNGILKDHPVYSKARITDTRIYNITIKQLLEHTAGWNRDINCYPNPTAPYPYQASGCDPIAAPLYISKVTKTTNPVTESALITYLLERGLNNAPGTKYSYSNMGYLILGDIIETKSGMSYEDFVKNTILSPLGICDMHLAKNLLMDKQEREAEYQGNGYTTLSCYGTGVNVPWEYGGFNIEAMDAHGGWIATARDLVKLIVAIDGFSSKPDILNANSISTMVAPSPQNANYAKGWSVNSANNWWHTGALDGTASFMARTSSGYTWAIIMNKRIIDQTSNQFWTDLDALPWNCISSTSTFPNHDLMLSPTVNSSNINVTSISKNSAKISWTPGNGTNRVVVCSKQDPVDTYPIDGKDYIENNAYGNGNNLGNANYVVYNNTSNKFTLSNLEANTSYYLRIFEYNKNISTANNALYTLCNSEQIKFTTNNLSNGVTNPNDEICTLKPNPNNGLFTILLKEELAYIHVEIYNSLGSFISEREYTKIKNIYIDISNNIQGIYYIRLKSKDGSILFDESILKM